MSTRRLPVLIIFFLFTTGIYCNNRKEQTASPVYDEALVQKVRMAASVIPGELPLRINYLKYAASMRKWNEVVEGGSEDPCTMARTAFQIEFPQGWIMVDAGMDRAVHHFFEKEKPQPFNDSAASLVARAVQQANLIVVTHEHGDHVAGVIRNANDQVPGKTILTRDQVNSLINNPQMQEIKLDENRSRQYIITAFESVMPVAPGVVLIKAPGHTPGEIMVYAKLENGKEYIFAGDVSWCYKGVAEKKQKPRKERNRIGENSENVAAQLAWLHQRLERDKMIVLVSHDDIMLPQYAALGFVGTELRLAK